MNLKRLEVRENTVLGRKEVRYLFEEGAGKITRLEAIKMVAADMGVKEDAVVAISLTNSHGSRDQIGVFRIYEDPKEAKLQLPRYIFVRNLPKEERKKLLEEERKKKAPKVARAK